MDTAFRVILLIVSTVLISAWGLMVVIGVVHNDWITACPPLGYWTAIKITSAMLIPYAIYIVKPVLLPEDG